MAQKQIFQPVRGTEKAISKITPRDNYIYFAYDTGNIYIDKNGARYHMGGNSTGIIYAAGNDSTIINILDPDNEPTSYYTINFNAFEDSTIIPKANELILNNDGRFFRIITVNQNNQTVEALLLAISGTNNGGSGGGTIGPITPDTRINLNNNSYSFKSFIYGQNSYIEFIPEADLDQNVILRFIITNSNGETIFEKVYGNDEPVLANQLFQFNMGQVPAGENLSINITLVSPNSITHPNGVSKKFNGINIVTLGVRKDNAFSTSNVKTGTVQVNYYIDGGVGFNLKVYPSVDGELLENLIADVNPGTTVRNVRIPAQSHGVHTIGIKVGTEVSSGTTVYTDEITYEIAWADPDDSTPLIWIKELPNTIIQYENCVINYMVYDPVKAATGSKAEVNLLDTLINEEISTVYPQYSNTSTAWLTWDLTENYHIGNNIFAIQCGVASKEITFNVTTEGSRDLGLVDAGILKLNLSSTGRSNGESLAKRTTWEYQDLDNNIYTTTFKNFNWYNNGWKDDKDGNGSYLSVANGASADINFTTIPFNTSNLSYTIELRFRIRNVQEYSTLVKTEPYYYVVDENGVQLENSVSINTIKAQGLKVAVDKDGNWLMDEANSVKITESEKGVAFKFWDSDTKQGLFVGTQEAYFKTPNNTVSVRYKEDDIINLTITAGFRSLLSIYLNGILAGAVDIGNNGFTPNTTKFEINSQYCDIDIYKLRVYEASGLPLTMPEVIHNYISDEHNLTLYDQNQLTKDDDATALSYKKILNYNNKRLAELQEMVSQGNNLDESAYNVLTMPYATIEIIDNTTAFKDPNKNQRSITDDRLPYVKGGKRYCEINFVNPVGDALLEAGKITEEQYYTHCPSYKVVGCEIDVQGTSSQGYPRRNFKTKMKSATNGTDAEKKAHDNWGWFYTKGSKAGKKFKKWNMDNPYNATNKFTWKIDYMESSGSYNTGFANLMGNMYDFHPLENYNFDGVSAVGYRTSVYGFPLLVFQKHSTQIDKNKIGTEMEDEIYEYIGRYNLNLDKSANEYYGFEVDGEQKYINQPWDEEIEENGETIIVHHEHPLIADIAECWELRDNQGTWTSFTFPQDAEKYKDIEGRNDYYFGTYTKDSYDQSGNPTAEPKLEVIEHFEYRYNSNEDELDACYNYDTDKYPDSLGTFGQINQYLREKYSNLEKLMIWLDSTNRDKATNQILDIPYGPIATSTPGLYIKTQDIEIIPDKRYYILDGNVYTLVNNPEEKYLDDYYEVTQIIEGEVKYENDGNGGYTVTYYKDTPAYRLEKFRNEARKHLNLDYCAIYYILTELLLCYDSRGKNMMIATWGPQEIDGDYIWYPIFYDIDTQLGLNNIGATLWDYDTDATADGTFSTPSSVLWVNFAAAFESKIISTYKILRSSKLTETNIEGAYLCDPTVFDSYAMRGVRPVIAIGLDEYVKYLKPSVSGYLNTDGNIASDSYGYVYAINGDRKLSRELLIRNRLNYLDSYWRAGSYSTEVVAGAGGCVIIRANANAGQTSDLFLDSDMLNELPSGANAGVTLQPYNTGITAGLDAIPEYTITPFLSQYVFTFIDTIPSGRSVKFQGTPVQAAVSDSILDGFKMTPNLSQQITRIPGPAYISSLGDLSTKYLDQFQMETAKRLLDLTLGSDIEGYYNNRSMANFILNDSMYDAGGALNINRKTLLQKVILTNMGALSEAIDLSGSEKLQEFRALGTQIQGISFAEGAPLTTIHLPKTVNGLSLVETKNLTKILTSRPIVRKSIAQGSEFYDHSTYEGLYIEDITDIDNSQVTLDLIGSAYIWQHLDNVQSESNLMNLSIKGGNLKYESYKLLLKAIAAKEKNPSSGIRLKIDFEDINWCPYTQLSIYDEYDINNSDKYYQATDHSTFIPYNYNKETWDQMLKNGKIYYYEASSDENIISSLDLLDFFIQDYNDGLASSTKMNHYTDIESSNAHWPRLTGILYVKNDSTQAIQEDKLTSIYAEKWPDLQIFVENVVESNIVKYVQLTADGKENDLEIIRLATNIEHPVLPSVLPSKGIHYDFLGWSTDIEGTNMFLTYDWENNRYSNAESELQQFTYSLSNNSLILYAQFQIHKHQVSFYANGELIGNMPMLIDYGTSIKYPFLMPAKDDSQLELTQTYKFIGYSTVELDTWIKDSHGKITMRNPAPNIITKDINLYAQFEEVSVYNNILYDEELIKQGEYYYDVATKYLVGNRPNQVVLQFNAKANELKGKITLPKTVIDPQTNQLVEVTAINVFGTGMDKIVHPNEITHIFQEEGSKLSSIGSNAFYGWQNLRYVELPQPNTVILEAAFAQLPHLFDNIPQNQFDDFFRKIIYIGRWSFWRSGWYYGNTDVYNFMNKRIDLKNIEYIGDSAFQEIFGPNVPTAPNTCTIVIGSSTNSNVNYSLWGTMDSGGGTITKGICSNSASAQKQLNIIYYAKNNEKSDEQLIEEIKLICYKQYPDSIEVTINPN